MKKLLIAIGLYFSFYGQLKAQSQPSEKTEEYAERKLKIEEINFVSSYYQQDGNNSAVTGGIGTEALFNVGNSLDITLSLTDRLRKKHTLNAQMNVDAYTSASSDNIDPSTRSGASRSDVHVYPSLSYSVLNPKTGFTKNVGVSFSNEYDYQSMGATIGFSQLSGNKNTEFSLKGGVFLDKWYVILPYELRVPIDSRSDEIKARNTYLTTLSLSHIVNTNFQFMLMAEPTYQEGLLSTPYHRVYFTDGSHTVEKLPGTRIKLPVSLRASYFAGDRVILKGFYRYYIDNWGMQGHTASLEVPVKVNPFFSVSPFYRFNRQTAVDYFKSYGAHKITDTYYTSDYDISAFDSHFAGIGLRRSTPGGLFGLQHFNALEMRLGYYHRSTGMNGGIATILIKLK